MRLCFLRAHDVRDADSPRGQGVRYETPVTAPRDRFGADHCRRDGIGEPDDVINGGPEFRSRHVVGIAPETGIFPAGIRRIAMGVTQTAQARLMLVSDVLPGKRIGQGVTVELRIGAGSRHGAHVNQPVHSLRTQHRDEFIEVARGMPDGKNPVSDILSIRRGDKAHTGGWRRRGFCVVSDGTEANEPRFTKRTLRFWHAADYSRPFYKTKSEVHKTKPHERLGAHPGDENTRELCVS